MAKFYLTVYVTEAKKKNGKRIYDKRLACTFCGKLFKHRLNKHFKSLHSEVPEIARLLVKSRKERAIGYELLGNRGAFDHNVKVLSDGVGELIIKKRSSKRMHPKAYLPCMYCLGFFIDKELWRHCAKCKFKTKGQDSKLSVIVQGRLLLAGAVESGLSEAHDDELLPVLESMHHDDIYDAVVRDKLICKYGTIMIRKLGIARKNDISQRIRQLARVKLVSGKFSQLEDLMTGKNFDAVVNATNRLCNFRVTSSGKKEYGIPSMAVRLGHLLLKCSQIKRGMALREDNDDKRISAENYVFLHQTEWTDRVSSIALATLKRNKFEKPQVLPLTDDLVKFRTYLNESIEKLSKELLLNPSPFSWKSLAEVVLCRLVIFNKRRSGEMAKLLVQNYTKRLKWTAIGNEEIKKTLSNFEKELVKK